MYSEQPEQELPARLYDIFPVLSDKKNFLLLSSISAAAMRLYYCGFILT